MIVTAPIHEAKTNLSELIKKAQAGDKVTFTSGREKTPVATIQPVEPARNCLAWDHAD